MDLHLLRSWPASSHLLPIPDGKPLLVLISWGVGDACDGVQGMGEHRPGCWVWWYMLCCCVQMVSLLYRILTCISITHLALEPFTTCVQHAMGGVTALFALSACGTQHGRDEGFSLPQPSCTSVMNGEGTAFLGAHKCSVGIIPTWNVSRLICPLSRQTWCPKTIFCSVSNLLEIGKCWN